MTLPLAGTDDGSLTATDWKKVSLSTRRERDGTVAEIAHRDEDVDVLARLELVRARAPLFEAEVDVRHLDDLHIEVVAVSLVEARLRLLLLGGNRRAASRLHR